MFETKLSDTLCRQTEKRSAEYTEYIFLGGASNITNEKPTPGVGAQAKRRPGSRSLPRLLSEYLSACAEDGRGSRFPNLAGFCHFAGTLPKKILEAAEAGERNAQDILLVLEDEVLNYDHVSATMATAYLKQYHGYGDRERRERKNETIGDTVLSFEHDITEDGG